MLFDPKAAIISRRRFQGGNYHVWSDANRNMQLCCFSEHERGRVLVPKITLDAFLTLECEGEKSVRFANPVSRLDVTVELDQLDGLEPLDNGNGKPFYLICSGDFASVKEQYPEPCGSN